MTIHKNTKLTPMNRRKICEEHFCNKLQVKELAILYLVSRPTIYKILSRGKNGDYSVHLSTNNRFRCLKYGIKRLAKIEQKLEEQKKREAKRYNKDYPGAGRLSCGAAMDGDRDTAGSDDSWRYKAFAIIERSESDGKPGILVCSHRRLLKGIVCGNKT